MGSLYGSQGLYRNVPVYISLMEDAIYYQDSKGVMLGNIDLDAVIGAASMKESREDGPWKIIIYRYTFVETLMSSCMKPSKLRKPNHVEFVMPGYEESQRWMNLINGMVCKPYHPRSVDFENGDQPRKRKFLVVINPHAGQGKSTEIWHDVVKGMLREANIEFKLFVTEGVNHAYLYILSFDWHTYDAILTLGGDGTLAEVVNGLCNRDDVEQALSRLVLVPVGGGTGNGLIKSILHSCDEEYSVENAIFAAVRGIPQPFDLAFVQTSNKKYHSFLLNIWGLLSDVDILSEGLRWMGEARLYFAAVYFILSRRVYSGRFSYLPTSAVSEPPNLLPPLNVPLPPEWEVIDGDFISIMIAQTSHCTVSSHSCPGAQLDDGVFSIQIIREASRTQLIELMLAFDQGEHVNHPCVFSYKAYAYRLEPFSQEGRYSLDGELIEYGPIQGLIIKRRATTFRLDHSSHDV